MARHGVDEPRLPAAVEFRGIVDLVYRQLREEIITGQLAAGSPLRQRQTADRLGVSREPVREALRLLEHDALLVVRPRRSSLVAHVSRKTIADVYEVRARLDPLAARRAAMVEDGKDDLVRSLCAAIDQAKQTDPSERSEFARLDAAFHRAIYDASTNDLAIDIFRRNEFVMRRVFSSIAASGWIVHSWPEHELIRDAIAAGDADKAEGLSREHVESACEWLLGHMDEASNFPEWTLDPVLLGSRLD